MVRLSPKDYEYRRTKNSVSSINESAVDIARYVKRRDSRILREEFPSLKKLPSFWSLSYFVATTG